jgi:pimeloyl-ACP methyl ester carboxylesterase
MAIQRQVFISYHRNDAEIARRVRKHLSEHGATTWMDEYDIPVGAYWPDEIDKGLAASETVIGILSSSSVESRNVKNEWDWAIQNTKRLVLLQVEPCVIPHRYVSINLIEVTGGDPAQAFPSLLRVAGIDPAPIIKSTPEFPETHYARSGDLSIAYQVVGEGPVDLVLVPGYISLVENYWLMPRCAAFLRGIASFSQLIIFDKRGTGLSDRISGAPTLEERMDDIRAVMDAAGSERAVLSGYSEGGPLACLFAATYPDRTRALIVYAGYASELRQPDYPWGRTREEATALLEKDAETLHQRWGTRELAVEVLEQMAPSAVHDDAIITWYANSLRLSGTAGSAIALDRMNLDIDIRGILPSIRVPTLVLHRTGDRSCPIGGGRYVAEHIPGARFIELPGEDHIPWIGDPNSILQAMKSFVRESDNLTATDLELDTVLATVLMVDLGLSDTDVTGYDAARNIVPALVSRFRGRELNATGHQVVATFDGPVRAIRCAIAICEALATSGMGASMGLHTGEIALGPAKAQSLPFRIAAQLASIAEPGEIIVSSTVKDLVAGSGIRFADRGSHALDGLPDEWRLFTVHQSTIP